MFFYKEFSAESVTKKCKRQTIARVNLRLQLIYRIGRLHGVVPGLISFDQDQHGLEVRTRIAVQRWFIVKIRRHQRQGGPVIRIGADGVDGVTVGLFHA